MAAAASEATESSGCLQDAAPQIVALLFSKDRAWQLRQTIDSLFCFCTGLSAIHVIYTASSKLQEEAYIREFESDQSRTLHLHTEQESGFRGTLLHVIQEIELSADGVLLAVDDVIFFREVKVQALYNSFKNSRLWCIHLKLDPSKEYCHPADAVCTVPRLTVRSHAAEHFVTWALSGRGSHDWQYPWDLCATLYRTADVQRLLQHLLDTQSTALDHPNSLEAAGNRLLSSAAGQALLPPKGQALLGALLLPAAACVTVNRVQDVYNNAIFPSHAQEASPDALAGWAGSGRRLDIGWYSRQSFASVHIGHLQCVDNAANAVQALLMVDVIMPVYNAASTVRAAVVSLLAPPPASSPALHVHLVLVDDGSTDGSWEAILDVLKLYGAPLNGADPPRLSTAAAALASDCAAGGTGTVSWTAVQCKDNGGISRALNIALACTRPGAAFIARLDADDLAVPGRLGRQTAFMQGNALQLAGSSAILITDAAVQKDTAVPGAACVAPGDYPLSRPSCHPVLLAWDMLWGCALVHPSVMGTAQWWRRADCSGSLHAPGGTVLPEVYRSATEPAEDYDLWLRKAHLPSTSISTGQAGTGVAIAAFDSTCVADCALVGNMGAPQVWYRKRQQAAAQEEAQRTQAAAAQLRAWNALLGSEHAVTSDVLRVLVHPDGTASASAAALTAAGSALAALPERFFDAVGLQGGAGSVGSIAQQASAAPSFSAVSAAALRRQVYREVEGRLSALAMGGMARLGPQVMPLLAQWRSFKAAAATTK